jgi:hypothetical protein
LALAGAILGGTTACNDHNPTVVFTGDAGGSGKSEAGSPQDSGGNHDGGGAADVAIAADVGSQSIDALLAVDLVPDVNPIVLDGAIDRALDLNQAADGPVPIDGAGPALDGSGGFTLEVGVDLSARFDGSGVGG